MARLGPISICSLFVAALALEGTDARPAVASGAPEPPAVQDERADRRQPGRSSARPTRRPSSRAPADAGNSGGQNPDRRRRGSTSLGGLDGGLDNPFGYPPDRQQKVWFSTADGDGTSWISFREARASMRFDAPRFRFFDTDNDGRMTFEEFRAFVISEAAEGRQILEPRAVKSTSKAPTRNAEQLRAAFDADLDGAISRFELEEIIREYDRRDASGNLSDLMATLDIDGSGVLEVDELERLESFVMPMALDPSGRSTLQPGARTVLELFGQHVDNGESHPPTIAGPVPPFRRLDVDNDGFVSLEDLERLEGRTSTTVRLGSVLNTLDIDYDGRLSEAEFLAAMTPKTSTISSSD